MSSRTAPPLAATSAGSMDEAVAIEDEVEERFDLRGRSLRSHTARGVLINSAFQVGLAGLGLAKRVGVAAFLTASEYGIWGLLVTTLITLTWLKQVGVGDKYVQQSERDQVAAFQKAFTLELLVTLIFYGVVLAALPLYALIYGRSEILVPGFVLALALLGSALQTPIWIAYRQMRFVRQRTLSAIDPVVSFIVTMALAASGFGYWSLIVGAIAGTATGATAALATCPYPIRLRLDGSTVRDYFGFSWPLFASSASGLLVVQGAVLVGNWTVGLAGVGAIGLAGSFAMFADRVDQIIRSTIYPAVCAVRDRTELLFEAFVKSNRVAMMWGIPFGVGLALFAPAFVDHVLGSRWSDATVLLQAFGLIVGLRQVAFSWTVFMSAVGDTRPMAVNGVVLLVTFAVVTAPLMIVMGLEGYALGMAISVAAELAVRGFYLRRLFHSFRLTAHMARAILPSVPAVAAVLALRAVLDVPGSLEVTLAELALYLAVTAAATMLFERRLVTEIAGYLRGPRTPGAAAPA